MSRALETSLPVSRGERRSLTLYVHLNSSRKKIEVG
jgi:hypothetical protein